MTPEELSDRLLNFAVRAGKVVDALPETRIGRHIASQLVRSGTSPAPNYDEACAALLDSHDYQNGTAGRRTSEGSTG
jgi:four helix bundle protein